MKKILVGLMVALAATFFVSCDSDSSSDSDVAKTYKVGETGPAGGIIFLVKDEVQTSTYTDGSGNTQTLEWKYLEAAPADCTGSNIYWGPKTSSYGTETESGKGWSNAKKIEAIGIDLFPAFSACASYGNGKYKDWFLPSLAELNLMYEELYTKNLGSFVKDGIYWSSSERMQGQVWVQTFNEGGKQNSTDSVANYYRVRPIRAFK